MSVRDDSFLLKPWSLALNLLLNKTVLLNGQWKVTTRTAIKAPFVCDTAQKRSPLCLQRINHMASWTLSSSGKPCSNNSIQVHRTLLTDYGRQPTALLHPFCGISSRSCNLNISGLHLIFFFFFCSDECTSRFLFFQQLRVNSIKRLSCTPSDRCHFCIFFFF